MHAQGKGVRMAAHKAAGQLNRLIGEGIVSLRGRRRGVPAPICPTNGTHTVSTRN